MKRSHTTGHWSDHGDPHRARRLARMWAMYVVIAWGMAGLVWLAWWVAQVGNYQDNLRGFEAGDNFPWVFVLAGAVAGVWCLPIAWRQRSRARELARVAQNAEPSDNPR